MKTTKQLIPALHNGIVLTDYWVDPKDGTIWSEKQTKNLRQIKGSIYDGYYKTRFTIDDKQCTLYLHRIVACTLIKFHPNGISKRDWKNTPEKIKNIILSQWCINHIDHDRSNYHPSNLEWATFAENSNASVAHRKANR